MEHLASTSPHRQRDLKDEITFGVIEGDQATINDAQRIRATGCKAIKYPHMFPASRLMLRSRCRCASAISACSGTRTGR